ncbi:MAG: hypothetical protein ACJAV6_000451 [Candidatus Paceibacteria bacterium]|jgi:hypothetical protein
MFYVKNLIKTEEDQINFAQGIFDGLKEDDDGYCACAICGSRYISDFIHALDDVTIACSTCSHSVSKNSYLSALLDWNFENRSSFQLRIIFP